MAETNTPDKTAPQPRKRSRSKKATTPPEKKEAALVVPVVNIPQSTHQPAAPNKTKRIWSFINTNSAVLDMFVNTLTFLVVSCFGTWLVCKQNGLMENQNALIKQQMSLDEASRRGALITLMSNIMDKVDDEIKEQKDGFLSKGVSKAAVDTMKFSLSQSLIGQIAALSHSFKPYRYMDGDSLISRPVSPERGQLLITLTQLPLDTNTYNKIYDASIFNGADLMGANLSGVYMSRVKLTGADLSGADLRRANLKKSNLSKTELRGADLIWTDLSGADFRLANLTGTYLIGADLTGADLTGADLTGADLSGTDLSGADLIWTDLSRSYLADGPLFSKWVIAIPLSLVPHIEEKVLIEPGLKEASSKHANITLNQAQLLKTLYKCNGLPDSISIPLYQIKPHLFEPKD